MNRIELVGELLQLSIKYLATVPHASAVIAALGMAVTMKEEEILAEEFVRRYVESRVEME